MSFIGRKLRLRGAEEVLEASYSGPHEKASAVRNLHLTLHQATTTPSDNNKLSR